MIELRQPVYARESLLFAPVCLLLVSSGEASGQVNQVLNRCRVSRF